MTIYKSTELNPFGMNTYQACDGARLTPREREAESVNLFEFQLDQAVENAPNDEQLAIAVRDREDYYAST